MNHKLKMSPSSWTTVDAGWRVESWRLWCAGCGWFELWEVDHPSDGIPETFWREHLERARARDAVRDLTVPVHLVPVSALGLSERPSNGLRRAGIDTLADLLTRRAEDLLQILHFGAKSLAEVKDRLGEFGFKLYEQDDPRPANPAEWLASLVARANLEVTDGAADVVAGPVWYLSDGEVQRLVAGPLPVGAVRCSKDGLPL